MNKGRPLWLISAVLLGIAALIVMVLREPQPDAPVAQQRSNPNAPADPRHRLGGGPRQPEEPLVPQREAADDAPLGEVSGLVVSTRSRLPIANAELTWANVRGAHSARSGPDGRFAFHPPSSGVYQLASARADGYLPFGPEWGKSPVSVVFHPGERVRGVTVELDVATVLTARVVDAKGRVDGATVRVLVQRREENVLFPIRDRFTTDARGEVRFHAEPDAVVEAFHATRGSGSARLEPDSDMVLITLEPPAADAGARVRLVGRVVEGGHGVPGALVTVGSALRAYPAVFGSEEGYRELTDDDGNFEIADLAPGRYDVSARHRGMASAHRFDVAVPASGPVVLELGHGARLSGRVSDEGQVPVPSFALSLEWQVAPLERLGAAEATFIDPQGRWSLEGVAPGAYVITVRSAGYADAAEKVTVEQSDVSVDLTLERGVTARGTVRSEKTRAPIAQARVALETGGTDVAAGTDESGSFVLPALPRRGFSLSASANGFNRRLVTVSNAEAPIDLELTPIETDGGSKLELTGIGAVLRGRGDALVIGQVIAGGGATEAGLVPGDELTGVDGHTVAELGFEPAIRAIRGPVGSVVLLDVRRGGQPPSSSVAVTRRKIVSP